MSARDLLAAEHALGLLEGEQLLEARGLAASDPAFARAVEEWHERLAPLLAEIGEEAPPQALWERVRAAVAAEGASETNVVQLKRKVGLWKGVSAAASAVAASLALVVGLDSSRLPPTAVTPMGAEVMVASLMSDSREMMLSVACRPDEASLMVMPHGMDPGPGRSYELWIIGADGKPHSLGLVGGSRPKRVPLDSAMAPMFDDTAMLAVSMEPEGGSPGDLPSGPMVASGRLQKV